jgi:hypothetical protein
MPTDFRNSRDFPRRARHEIDGFLWLARVFDKARAAQDGTIHDYIYPCPMDRGVFDRWGITSRMFDAALDSCDSDDGILTWIRARVNDERRQTRRGRRLRSRVMRRTGFVAFALALLAAAGCDNGVPRAQNYATVFGRVYDAKTNQGLAGVTVTADTVLVAVTAADGSYSLSPVPSGQTDMLVAAPDGYTIAAQPAAFSVVNGDHVRVDIPLDLSP